MEKIRELDMRSKPQGKPYQGQKNSKPFGGPKKVKVDPESAFLHRLKGENVIVEYLAEGAIPGKLLWVSKYSFGVEVALTDGSTNELLIYKHAISSISPTK